MFSALPSASQGGGQEPLGKEGICLSPEGSSAEEEVAFFLDTASLNNTPQLAKFSSRQSLTWCFWATSGHHSRRRLEQQLSHGLGGGAEQSTLELMPFITAGGGGCFCGLKLNYLAQQEWVNLRCLEIQPWGGGKGKGKGSSADPSAAALLSLGICCPLNPWNWLL